MALRRGDVSLDIRTLERDYRFIRDLGRGGMAVVYLASHRRTGRLVAVKAIHGRHVDDVRVITRFSREARTVSELDHPNIVRTYAVEQIADRTVAIVMQYIPGGTLREALRATPLLPYDRVWQILHDVAEALRYAHDRGVVHRDVKPENIFLDENTGRALLSDFGIAHTENEAQLTLTGSAVGTPRYMSPEQIEGKVPDRRSDLYSLGVVGWEMLAGRAPWEGESLYSVMYKHKNEELPRLTTIRPDIPVALLYAVEGALHKHREERWADAGEFLSQLIEDGRAGSPLTAEPPGREEHALAPARAPARADDNDRTLEVQRPFQHDRGHLSGRRPRAHLLTALGTAVLLVVTMALALTRAADRRGRGGGDLAQRHDTLATITRGGSIVAAETTITRGGSIVRGEAAGIADSAPPSAPRSRADSLRLCDSPAARDQRACFFASLTEEDVELNRVYRELIAAMRRRAGTAPGAGDPLAVQRLRVEQRAWLTHRDVECRRLGQGREGRLWASSRARCLGEFADRRVEELTAMRERLVAPDQ